MMVTRGPYKVVYIDDEPSDWTTRRIQESLHRPGQLECELKRPPKNIVDAAQDLPDALLVDFDLSTQPLGSESLDYVSYYGSTLAAEVRIRQPSCPIILVTKKERIEGYNHFLKESIDFDLILFKDEIIQNPAGMRAQVETLIVGFQALDAVDNQEWQAVLSLMGAGADQASLLREAAPPVTNGKWNVPQTAHWIRNTVMKYPGILYDDLTAATRLGISLDAFETPQVQELLQGARYRGVFDSHQQYWWRDALFTAVSRLAVRHNLRGSIAQTFGQSFQLETGLTLDPAICVYDGTPIADWVCYILQKPVKQTNSVPYYPEERPPVMDQARVSFRAIEEEERFDEMLVDADSLATVHQLWGVKR